MREPVTSIKWRLGSTRKLGDQVLSIYADDLSELLAELE